MKSLAANAHHAAHAPHSVDVRWLAVGIVLALAVAAAALLWYRLRKLPARIAKRAPKPHHPVVLAHGIFGFDEIALGKSRHAYFRGVPTRLEKSGHVVHAARVAKAAGVATRAAELASFVRALPDPRVNIVAHSMGGLDARYAIAKLGLADRVASLTTIGTPHRGTPVADVGSSMGAKVGLTKLLSSAGLGLDAVEDLTSAKLERFNRDVPDHPKVAYGCIVGSAKKLRRVNPLLLPTYLFLREREGENDGMVPAGSQRWGELLGEIDADHWAQIGWSRHFDAAEFYASLLRELRGRGF